MVLLFNHTVKHKSLFKWLWKWTFCRVVADHRDHYQMSPILDSRIVDMERMGAQSLLVLTSGGLYVLDTISLQPVTVTPTDRYCPFAAWWVYHTGSSHLKASPKSRSWKQERPTYTMPGPSHYNVLNRWTNDITAKGCSSLCVTDGSCYLCLIPNTHCLLSGIALQCKEPAVFMIVLSRWELNR